ncbi:hypothetical protein VNO77_22149 [Canavalia gladiata]|uniref:Uncharacterized protein n=1 Tax=Canavalia gladiata TaxID=3824 RepID=A0AAN9QAS3_CANGL
MYIYSYVLHLYWCYILRCSFVLVFAEPDSRLGLKFLEFQLAMRLRPLYPQCIGVSLPFHVNNAYNFS